MSNNFAPTTIDPDYFSETLDIQGEGAVQSGVITTGSGLVRIATTSHCHIKFGSNPTATENDTLMPPNHVEVFRVKSGDKLSLIAHAGGTGELTITAVE